jgi:hypothetical protein
VGARLPDVGDRVRELASEEIDVHVALAESAEQRVQPNDDRLKLRVGFAPKLRRHRAPPWPKRTPGGAS